MTSLSLRTDPLASLAVDVVVVGVCGDDGDGGGGGVRLAAGAESVAGPAGRSKSGSKSGSNSGSGLERTLAAVGAETKAGAVTRVPSPEGVRAPVVLAAGLGPAPADGEAYDMEALRKAAGAAARALAGTGKAAFGLPARTPEEVEAVGLGAQLGAYTFTRYRRNGAPPRQPVRSVTVATSLGRDRAARAALRRSEHVAAGVALARDLVNTAPVDLHPAELAAEAVRAGKEHGLRVDVLDEKALAKGGYGGLLGVGQGSTRPPRLVRVAYTHPRAKRTLAVCGKGITFDSGGLSLKTNEGMKTMKCDMAGAAAVLGAVVAVAGNAPKVNVVGYLACAENMPGGAAQRPSDVLTTYGGTTVEVLNTDAEGRLVLADALGRALEDDPDLLVDVATLTGAQIVALGARYFAVMANDDDARARVVAAAGRAGESAWPMPLPPELREALASDVADIANVAEGRGAGMLVAGTFLSSFVPAGQAWAHLDIAGPAWSREADGYTSKGGTGATVRTLVQLADDLAGS